MNTYDYSKLIPFGAICVSIGIVIGCGYMIKKFTDESHQLISELRSMAMSINGSRTIIIKPLSQDEELISHLRNYQDQTLSCLPLMVLDDIVISPHDTQTIKLHLECTTPVNLGAVIISKEYSMDIPQKIIRGNETIELVVRIKNFGDAPMRVNAHDISLRLWAGDFGNFYLLIE